MHILRSARLACCAVLLAGTAAVSAAAPALRESFDLQVPVAPAPLRVEGVERLAYELHLTNFAAQPLRLRALEVRGEPDGAPIARFEGDALAARSTRIGVPGGKALDGPIAPGERAVVYVELAPAAGAMPAHLAHRLTYTAGEEAGEHAVAGATVAVERVDTVPVIGPPVRGGPWVVIHDASWPRGHRRVFYAVDGRARLPGRHATDWVRVDDDGRTARGDAKLARDALGYGEAVIAVADATVAAVRDGYAEHARVADNRKHPPADAAGNHVVLSLGDGRFAFYEHLRPGSVRVRAGQRVRRGDVLGELGFSGDSTGPHLHFHVADAASPLGSEGRPFALERFRSLGRYADLSRLGKARWDARDAEADAVRTAELPQGNSVIVVEGAR